MENINNKDSIKNIKKLKKQIKHNDFLNRHPIVEPPKRSVLEEIGSSVSHGIGCVFAIIGLVLLLQKSTSGLAVMSSIIYMTGLFFMCINSCLYHAFRWGKKVKRIWRRFDYTSIYLLIASTFAPLQLIELAREYPANGEILGVIYFIIMWALTILGITLTCVFGPERTRKVNFPLYFIIGWSAVLMISGWVKYNMDLFIYILAGGIVYCLGMIPFAAFRNKPVCHFLWHLFVLAGAIIQFIGIYIYVYCA